MANLTADSIKVLKKEKTSQNGNTYYQFSLMVSSKDKEGNWVNGFLECDFRKEDREKITDKCKIKINNAFPVVNSYNGKTSIKWMITDFEVLEGGNAPTQSTSIDENFMNIDINVEEAGLPFN